MKYAPISGRVWPRIRVRPMIKVLNLTKIYDDLAALDNVTLNIKKGEKVSVFGHNGAGKTTFLRILAGLIHPTAGMVLVAGLKNNQPRVMRKIGFAGNETYFYEAMTIMENLSYYGAMYDMSKQLIKERSDYLLDLMNLADKINQPVKSLSKGMKQKLVFVRSVFHNPEILLLDEPFSGLDFESTETLKLFLGKQIDKTIIMATHDAENSIEEGTRVIIFKEGRVADDYISSGKIEDFKRVYKEKVSYG